MLISLRMEGCLDNHDTQTWKGVLIVQYYKPTP